LWVSDSIGWICDHQHRLPISEERSEHGPLGRIAAKKRMLANFDEIAELDLLVHEGLPESDRQTIESD
jgi:hypothetical protein